MARKRMTDADVWRDPWYRTLPPMAKLFWRYVCDNCDLSGVWPVDQAGASFEMGTGVDLSEMLNLFGEERILVLPGGKKWALVKYIPFHYPNGFVLSVNAHVAAHILAVKNRLPKSWIKTVQGLGKGRPTHTDQDTDTDTDKEGKGSAEGKQTDSRLRPLVARGVKIDRADDTRGKWLQFTRGMTAADIEECAVLAEQRSRPFDWPSKWPPLRAAWEAHVAEIADAAAKRAQRAEAKRVAQQTEQQDAAALAECQRIIATLHEVDESLREAGRAPKCLAAVVEAVSTGRGTSLAISLLRSQCPKLAKALELEAAS